MLDKNLVDAIIGGKDLDCGSAELNLVLTRGHVPYSLTHSTSGPSATRNYRRTTPLTSVELAAFIGTWPSRDGKGMFVVGRLAQGSVHFYDEKEKRFLPYLGGLPATQLVVSPDRKWMVYTDYPRGDLALKDRRQREVATHRDFCADDQPNS
jgi:hypothetical protein